MPTSLKKKLAYSTRINAQFGFLPTQSLNVLLEMADYLI